MLARQVFPLLTGLLLCISIVVCAQSPDDTLERKLTLEFERTAMSVVLDTIIARSQIPFSFSRKKIDLDEIIDIKMVNEPLKDVLQKLFKNTDISYELIEGTIVLKKSKARKNRKSYTISGHLRDNLTGETLIGATVYVQELETGNVSNAYGFYSITVPAGQYSIRYSYIGFLDDIREVDLSQDQVLDINLDLNVSQLEEVVVLPSDSVQRMENLHANALAIDNSTMIQKTAALGESDVIKSLDVIPGIQLFRDGSTFYNVRGGDRDQNQILLDEAPIYNPAHFLGLFSSIMPEAVKDVKLYKGDLPAQMGGRLSSVLDIKTRDGNLKELSANGSLGLISGRLAIEGPIKRDKSSFFISGRHSYIEGILRSGDDDLDALFFNDLNVKTNIQLNKKNRLFLSAYVGNDKFVSDGGIKWGNKAASIRLNRVHTQKLFSNTSLYASRYEYFLFSSSNLTWQNHIANISLKSDFTLYKRPDNTLKFGFKFGAHNFNPGNAEDSTGNLPPGRPFVPKRNASDFSLYFSKERKLNEKLLLTYGFRLSSWTNFGKTIEFEIDENFNVVDSTVYDTRKSYNDYSYLEPRLSLTYISNPDNIYKFNYSRSAQYINLISNSISPFNNLEVWLPASINIKPQISDQFSIGWFRIGKEWNLSMEGYYKYMQNQIDYKNQPKLLLNAHLEAELRTGSGSAIGLETMLTKNTGRLTGWVSYTLSRSRRKIEGINDGNSYPSLWDKPHQLAVNANYAKSNRTFYSGTLYLSSGAPITTPTSFYQYSGRTVPIYTAKNNDRLPFYNRFDVSWNHRLNKYEKKFNHYLTVSLFNIYGRQNSVLENFNKIETSDNEFIVPTDINASNEVVSTKIFVFSIVPSITYSFRI